VADHEKLGVRLPEGAWHAKQRLSEGDMLKRRTAMTMVRAVAPLIILPVLVCGAWAQPNDVAVALVKNASDKLAAIANGTGSPEEKRRHLQSVIDATVDVDAVARFCLGRFWRNAAPDEQQEYMKLFRELLVTEIAGRLGEYQGVRITMGLARANANTEVIATTVERPGNPTMQIDWVVATNIGGPKIVDLLAEGTSMRLTHSADFTAYLMGHQYSIHELVEVMRQRIVQKE
jgi:phospholipid transport system substrate-binding protein